MSAMIGGPGKYQGPGEGVEAAGRVVGLPHTPHVADLDPSGPRNANYNPMVTREVH